MICNKLFPTNHLYRFNKSFVPYIFLLLNEDLFSHENQGEKNLKNCGVGSYHSRDICQECLDQDHRGNVQGHAGYDPRCTSSAPYSASLLYTVITTSTEKKKNIDHQEVPE